MRCASCAPAGGVFQGLRQIGDRISRGDLIGRVEDFAVASQIDGVLRGILHDGLVVHAGMKVADVDPRGVVEYCFTVSDKAWAVGGGVLEAILRLRPAKRR